MEAADAAAAASAGGGSGEKKKATQDGVSAAGAAAGGGGSGGGTEKPVKRKMKTAYQLELLEQTYAVESYPSEQTRAELSVKIGLSDRQLQMWFCHRRLKDRKATEMAAAASASGSGSGSGHVPRKALARMSGGGGVPRVAPAEMPPVVRGRYYEPVLVPQPTVSEMRAIAFVESQLGEQIREDGPILGVEFDPLPPGAFGAPIEVQTQVKLPTRPYDAKIFERHDTRHTKAPPFLPNVTTPEHCFIPGAPVGKKKPTGSGHIVQSQAVTRSLHEYQFLPEQPSGRSDVYDRMTSHYYDPSIDSGGHRLSPMQSGGPFFRGGEQVAPVYSFHDQMPTAALSRQGSQNMFSSGSAEYEALPHKTLYPNSAPESTFIGQHVVGMENSFLTPDRRIYREEDNARSKKRKSEEARIAKEVEAHEKRIRKELEKQDILRRKREEQMRKEMERHDRERRKEEERLLREKQREEERYQRELRRENERREKFLQKESLRAEKMRLKEETRREKEAARVKAANERATARKLAKEYMELIEDERLELMELAASRKGLQSIISLDSEALQNLSMFRDMLKRFPPKSVPLKLPFTIQPWVDSEENVGNLLMVWKFFSTFADVLSLWPFTLDEFIQALHDYDSRLLGEIHIALLRSIINDIEDVARAPATSAGANHNSAANPAGGHPQIVEGAYAWGFDIRSWQRHLNPLAWPEILRQFALSAGFGPQLKKRTVEKAHHRDENEGQDSEDIISILRSGAAAENALAIMREKGFTHLRRSRHRLTPGTVKFAAFHVLSLEGSKGLTILEVAERIQKSGLRDLTTSKTPEASIAAALSRDVKLFERTAPSTYCVRTPYRKNPADAEAILSAAREKIQIFQNGLSESEAEKECEDVDDAERDEDSDSDGDDPDIDEISIEKNLPKNIPLKNEVKATNVTNMFGNGKEALPDEVGKILRTGNGIVDKSFSTFGHEEKDRQIIGARNDVFSALEGSNKESNTSLVEDAVIDESISGEPWVLGLVEGEYSDLSIEERLGALVALIGVAIEGNSIRVILEERLEAASSLKKQMWADAQLDKRRVKEEYLNRMEPSFISAKPEPSQVNASNAVTQSPSLALENKGSHANLNSMVNLNSMANHEPFVRENSNNLASERNMTGQDFPANLESAQNQQYGYAAEKSRSQMKLYIGHKAEEIYVYRSLPLGQDRRCNRYWQFVASASKSDPGCGRIFFESRDGFWRLIDSEEAFDALLASLDTRGIRESHLYSMLQKIETLFKEAVRRGRCQNGVQHMNVSLKTDLTCKQGCQIDDESPISTICGDASDPSEHSMSFMIEVGRNDFEKTAAFKRFQDFQKWLWKECYNSTVLCSMKYGKKRCPELLASCSMCCEIYFCEEKHCLSCHKTFKNFHNMDSSFADHVYRCEEKRRLDPKMPINCSDSCLPTRVRLLKIHLSHIEASIPSEALLPFWTEGYRKSWGVKLCSSSSAENLFQLLTLLEGAIKRDWLSPKYETTNELLSSYLSSYSADETAGHSGSVPVLPWIPKTTAAVGLRLMDLDASISYALHQKIEAQKEWEAKETYKLPSRYSGALKNDAEFEPTDTQEDADFQDYGWGDPGFGRMQVRGRGGYGRGRGRGKGGRGQRASSSLSRYGIKEEKLRMPERTSRRQTRGRARGRGGRGRGRRSVRPRQRFQSRPPIQKDIIPTNSFLDVHNSYAKHSSPGESLSRSSEGEDWPVAETPCQAYADADDNSMESSSGSEDNDQQYADDYDDRMESGYGRGYDDKAGPLIDEESEDYEVDVGETEGNQGDGDYEMEDMEDDVEEDDEDMGDDDGDEGNTNRDEDEGLESYSSDYSD